MCRLSSQQRFASNSECATGMEKTLMRRPPRSRLLISRLDRSCGDAIREKRLILRTGRAREGLNFANAASGSREEKERENLFARRTKRQANKSINGSHRAAALRGAFFNFLALVCGAPSWNAPLSRIDSPPALTAPAQVSSGASNGSGNGNGNGNANANANGRPEAEVPFALFSPLSWLNRPAEWRRLRARPPGSPGTTKSASLLIAVHQSDS